MRYIQLIGCCMPFLTTGLALADAPLSSTLQADAPKTVAEIDDCISLLQQQRAKYQSQYLFASRRAERLITQDWSEYNRSSAQAERYQQLVQDIDSEIAALRQQREQLLQKQNR